MIKHKWIVVLLAGFLLVSATFIPVHPTIYAQAQTETSGTTIHVVQRGETLYRIAMQYGMTIDELATLNGLLNPGNIQVGQRLLVPARHGVATEDHIVQPGETLRVIADLYRIPVDELASWNNITEVNAIYAGQRLSIIPNTPDPVTILPIETAQAIISGTDGTLSEGEEVTSNMPDQTIVADEYTTVVHVVARGDTLYQVAMRYGVTVNAILRANPIDNAETIYTGQQLIIPGVQAPQLAAVLPAPLTRLEVMPIVLVEGQTGRFRMGVNTPSTINATFLNQNLQLAIESENLLASLVGIPVGTEAGIYPLSLNITQADGVITEFVVNVQVVSGGYGRERINLMDGRDDLLNTHVEDAENLLVGRVLDAFNPERYMTGAMGLPAAAAMTSPFGSTRSYNGGEFSRIHAGIDFAGASGTPILAAAPGRVVMVDELHVRGLATIIDHGWGVYTGYWHQSERYVNLGDWVEARQVIGAVGSSGRVTGPHLHWEVWVNGVPVDPMQWLRVPFM